jgi:DDE superfamily endonuclease
VIPRTFPPAPGWSGDGHRIKAPLEYSRGPEKTWVYGGLRVADGQAVTMCAPSRNSQYYQDFLRLEEQANPEGTIWVITDNLSSHDSKSTRAWLEDHPHPARLHPQARLLAEHAGRLVTDLPAPGASRAGLRGP